MIKTTTENRETITDTKIVAKVIPFRCVVCKGFGTVNYGQRDCKACDKKGYILVQQEEQEDGGKLSRTI